MDIYWHALLTGVGSGLSCFLSIKKNYVVNLKLSFNGSPAEMVLLVGDMSLKYVVQKGKVHASVFKNGLPS